MRKLKLLFAAAALMLGVGGASAQQQDVTKTYLTNADFASGTAIDNNVCTYGKDMAGNGTTYYGAQAIEGWTNASVGETDSGYENSKLAGAIFAYGSTPWLAGTGTPAPATDPEGNAGNAAGLCAVWGGSIQYTQDVTLPAGSYTLRFKVYNATTNNGSGKFITTNLFGFVPNEGTAYYAPNRTFAIGQWSTVAVTFNLTEETAGKISMGFVSRNEGNANMPHLFVDNVKILKNTYFEDVTSKVGVAQASWTNASDGLQGTAFKTSDGRDARMAAFYGSSAAGKKIYQTVTGLSKGTYEAVVFAYSMNEWGNYSAGLANDAGDVGYVLADGKYQVKEWINARKGTHNANDYGIYTLSGIEVDDDGVLELAYVIDKANQTEWMAIQIQSLIYTKNLDLSGIIAAYETALANAQTAAAKTDPMQTSLKDPLNEAISTYGDVDKNDGDAMETATTALLTATDAVNNSIAAYANAKAYFDEAEPILTNTNFYTAVAYATYYSEPKAKYDAGTLTTDEANALKKLGGWHDANTIDDILLSAWTIGGEQCANYDKSLYINTWSVEGNSDGSNFKTPFFEYWVNSGSLAANTIQGEITGLIPDGLYKVDVWARLQKSADFAENGITLQVGAGTAIDLTTATQVGSTDRYADVFTASGTADADGKLTVKIVVAESSGCSWLSFKNVKYAELADERIPYAEQLATAVAEAKSLSTTLVISDALKTKLFNAADKYQDYTYTSLETVAAFEAAINEVNDAIETAKGEEATYAAWKALKAYADALVDVANDNASANSTLATAISDQNTAVEVATTAAGIETATSTLKDAMVTYVGVANPTEGNKFDLTFMLTNPDLTEFWDGTWWIKPAGWYTDQEGGNFQVMNNNSVNAEDGVHTIFMEYYYLAYNPHSTWGNGKFNIYTKATLPAGTYTMNCYAFAKEENYSSGNPNPQVFFYANDTQGSKVNSSKLTEQSISFINETEQEVKIGLKPLSGNTYNWMGIGYVKLYKEYTDNTTYAINVTPTGCNVVVTVDDVEVTETKATKTVTLTVTPNKEYESSSVTVTATYNDGENVMDLDVANPSEGVYTYPQPAYDVNVTVTYEYLANMNITDAQYATFIAPFDVEIPNGVTAYTVNQSKGEMLLMEPLTGTLSANTPVVLYSESPMSQDFKGQSTAEKDAYTEGLLTGTYVSMNKDALDGKYILQKHEGDVTPAFYKVDATKEADPYLAPNRCYLTDTNNSSKLRFSFGEEDATAINGLEVLTSGKYDAIYNAAGVKVNALQKGMNIIQKGGKSYKIFVK